MNAVLYMHGGSGNHGCEALVRTTTHIIKEYLSSDVILWSTGKEEDLKYGLQNIVDSVLKTEEMSHKSLAFLISYLKFKLLKRSNAMEDLFLKKIFKNSIALSIGGDNYCYPWSAKQGVELNNKIRKYCYKNVFWGCSIEEEALTSDVIEDIKGFDLIIVRESLSYDLLKNLNKNTYLAADPAFLLKAEERPLPSGFKENNTVGINISPLINDYQSKDNIAFDNYVNLIKHILSKTDMNICLIPHVVWEYNNDLKSLNMLMSQFSNNDRVIMISDGTCEELKGYIKRCRFFVGARTHSTIAAYSSCVPTLVVGYSIKSRGIAKDIFGSYNNHVISVQDLKSKDDLVNAFDFIYGNEIDIRSKLNAVMPGYINSAYKAGEHLLNQIER